MTSGVELFPQTLPALTVVGNPRSQAGPAAAIPFAEFASSLADSSLIDFIQAGTGAVTRTEESKLRESVSVFDFLTTAQKADVQARTALLDVTAGIQAAEAYLDSTFGGGTLRWPVGTYLQTSALVKKKKVIWQGEGMEGTILLSAFTGNAVESTWPINSSTPVYISIRDMTISNTNVSNTGAGFQDIGGSFVSMRHVRISGFKYSIVCDQTELFDFDFLDLENPLTACIWLVNGSDGPGGGSAFFTNRGSLLRSQLNAGAGVVGVADDGGAMHVYAYNNLNGMSQQLRICGSVVAVIHANESEGYATDFVEFPTTKLKGGAAAASVNCTVSSNAVSSSLAIPCMKFGASTLGQMKCDNNSFINNNGSGTIVSGVTNVTKWSGENNTQGGSGADPDATFVNTKNVSLAFSTITWKGDSVDPAIGNGTLTANYQRQGNQVTINIDLTAGTTTTFGTGQWYFTLPFPMVGNNAAQGSVRFLDSSASTFFTAISLIDVASPTKLRVLANNTSADVGPTVPITWATSDQLHISLTYPITQGAT